MFLYSHMLVVPVVLLQRSESQHREVIRNCSTFTLQLPHEALQLLTRMPSAKNNIKNNEDSKAKQVSNISYQLYKFHSDVILTVCDGAALCTLRITVCSFCACFRWNWCVTAVTFQCQSWKPMKR